MEQGVNDVIVNELNIQFKNLGLINECINDVRNALIDVSKVYKEEQKSIDEAYQRGLTDAWEAVRKIIGMDAGMQYAVFNTYFNKQVFENYSASEAIEKLKAYEGHRDKDLCGGCIWEDRFDGDCSMCSNNYRWLYRAKDTTC